MGCSPHKIQKQRRIVLVLVLVLETGPEKSDYENEDDDEDEISRKVSRPQGPANARIPRSTSAGIDFTELHLERLDKSRQTRIGIDISPKPAASWPNACATFAPAGKRTALAKPDVAASSATGVAASRQSAAI
jgi:hypothetical protein